MSSEGISAIVNSPHPPQMLVELGFLTAVKVDSAWCVRYRPSADAWAECRLAEACGVALVRCLQVRERRAFAGSTNKRGWYYLATTGEMKWCESRLEMRVLRLLDHDRSVVAVGVQPFVLHYRDDAGRASHTPDVFCRRRDGVGDCCRRPTRALRREARFHPPGGGVKGGVPGGGLVV